MSSERQIIFRLREGKSKLNENWPPVFNKMEKYNKDALRKYFSRIGVDIENIPVNTTVVTNGRDAQLKDPNTMIVFDLGKHTVAVSHAGKFIVNPYVLGPDTYAGNLSWKALVDRAEKIYKITWSQADVEKMKGKQASRSQAQQGRVVRNPKDYRGRLDKSGYPINPSKYKEMLAKLNMRNVMGFLDKAYKIYNEMASKLNIDMDYRQADEFDSIMRGLSRYFADLKRYDQEYEGLKKKYGEDRAEKEFYYQKKSVEHAVYDLQNYVRQAEKFLRSIK